MKWHSFRKRGIPIITPVAYYFVPYSNKKLGVDFEFVHILKLQTFEELIPLDCWDGAVSRLFHKLLRNPQLLGQHDSKGKKVAKAFISFCRQEISGLDEKTNAQLIRILNKYYRFYQEFSLSNIMPWVFLPEKIEELLRKKLSDEEFIALTTPSEMSYSAMRELELYLIALKMKRTGKDLSRQLARKYFWIPFDYLGPEVWGEEHCRQELRQIISKGNIEARIKSIKARKKAIASKQKKLEKNISQHDAMLCTALRKLAMMQDEKKAVTTESHYYLQQLFKEIAKRSGTQFSNFYFMMAEEVAGVLLRDLHMEDEVARRKELSVTIVHECSWKILTGSEANDYLNKNGLQSGAEETKDTAEIRGFAASRGKTVGQVRILMNSSNLNSFREGEILVAPMTTPDFVPAMNKAKAIVTNEGGVTCHAAIISRELGIPCVIGTKNATDVLKNGETVEVDGIKGIVRRLR